MKNKKKYRLGEVKENVSEMEFEDRCDEIVEVDDDMQLLRNGSQIHMKSALVRDLTVLKHTTECLCQSATGRALLSMT